MKRLAALALSAALLLGTAGCAAGEAEPSSTPAPEPTPSQQAQPLPFALAYDPEASLHPITSQSQVNLDLAGLVYEGLYELDQAFEAQPALAQSAAVSEDGLTWTITLRSGVRFSDGTSLTASQVVSSLNTARSSALYAGRLSAVTGVTAAEDGTVVIALSSPNGALPSLLDIPIVLEQEGGLPLGTGRYRFVQAEDGLRLEVNGNYPDQVPYDVIPLRGVTGADRRIAAFDSGEVTAVVTDFTASYALGYSGSYETCDFPTSTLLYVGFKTTTGACRQALSRQAIARALDRETAVSLLMAGHGDAAALPISPLHQEYHQQAADALSYDPQAAAQLLTQAGYTLGEDGLFYRGSIPLSVTIVVNHDSAFKQALADFLAQCLAEVGITATVNKLPWEQYLNALEQGQFDLYIGEVRLTPDFDPSQLLTGALNYGGYVSQTLPALLDTWRGARGEDRQQAAAQLWQAFAQEVPIAPLCFKRGSLLLRWGMAGNVQPTQADPFWNLEEWKTTQ